ncbi:lycopene cyclase domain-containing protein [Kocuria coralli]|uniref:Lycopene cyclase domain-containing protein n=1 Tax=Kocuria coralli TaxID=1461025 RepID=A0A5J5KZQ5_9MICC|nr:lycopene cyclase domain-containing protein [Kocuria coralli]KAA9395043.1 lycopene cyclase domain-containing protein [Kocuria coralli]
MSFAYLAALLVSLAGMIVWDVRERLFFARDAVRAAVVLAAGVAFFLLWDIAGILTGIFLHAPSRFATGWMLGPHMPVEEPVFLIFLCYLTMNLVLFLERVLRGGLRAGRRGSGDDPAGEGRR